jgi:hypothetical protein
MSDLNTYDILLKISQGDESAIQELPNSTLDELTVKIRFNKKNPLNSVVTLEFDNSSEYYGLFYHSDDADIVDRVLSYYNNYDLVGYGMFEQEWEEGYMLNTINDTETLRKIIQNTSPTFKIESNNWGGFEDSGTIAKMLSENYDREVSNIVEEYEEVVNSKLKQEYSETITSDLANKLTYLNLYEVDNTSKYVTNLKSLINLYKDSSIESIRNGTIYEMLQEYCQDMDITRNFYDSITEDAYNLNVNPEFSDGIKIYLERMLESSEEKYLEFPDLNDVRQILQVIDKLGGFNRWIDLVSKQNRKIKFLDVNYDNASITYLITKEGGQNHPDYEGSLDSISEKRSLKTVDELNQVLHQPELFEHYDIKYNRILSEQLETNLTKGLLKQFYLENNELFNGNPRPISDLNSALKDFNSSNKYDVNLNLDTLMKMSKETNPMFKLDLFFINNGKMERPIWSGNLEFGKDLKFTLSRTPNNNFVPGIKLTF